MTNGEIIIVGGGSAGCIVAHTLATRFGSAVTLIEPPSIPASPVDRDRPASWLNLLGSGDDWDFSTTTVDSLASRSLRWPRGRGLGGSCRINAMIWFPPTPGDLAKLADQCRCRVEQLRESFQAVESIVRTEPPRWVSESSKRFLRSVTSMLDGQGMVYRRVNRRGRRWNPAELLAGTRVHVVRANVDRVIFAGDRACGVQLVGGETITCSQAVILCAGAIGTPTILMRSGIGPPDTLQRCNIDVRQDCNKVGKNLHDHLVMPVILGIDPQHQFNPSTARDIARWQTVGAGPLSSNIAECGGLFDDARLQIHVTPTHYLSYPDPSAAAAMTIAVNPTGPKSRGRLTIATADPSAPPIIEPNYLYDETDLQTTIAGIRLARRIAAAKPLANWTTGELLPGSKRESDESLARSIQRYAQSLYHPVGTCAMGPADEDVVNERFQVRGVDQLGVVDASVLSSITTGNPNATVMTLGHWAIASQHS